MKKVYQRAAALIAICCGMIAPAQAQLSGTVTIDSSNPTSGSNYQSFTDFANDINSLGVSGPLTVNVVTGTGPYVEQVIFNQVSGASATNQITVNGNGNTITYSSSSFSSPHVIGLNGADYMNFVNLNITGTGSYAYPAILWGGADYNTFTACTFSVPANTTTSYHMPVVISGSGSSYSTWGNSANYCTFEDCSMYNGYYGISMYSNPSGPFATGNKVINCNISDWYSRGISLYYYHVNSTLYGNTIQQPTRTSVTTTYGIYAYYNQGTVIEANRIQAIHNGNPTTSSTTYGMYVYYNSAGGGRANPNIIKNNIISDIKGNGTIYGLYAYYIDGYVLHNTISLDYTSSTSGTTYGMRLYGQSGMETDAFNNIVSITKGGSSSKYGLYYGSGYIRSDNNDVYVNSAGGGNNFGYYSGNQSTQAAFVSASNLDSNSVDLDPQFTSISGNNYIPTNSSINNLGASMGVVTDIDGNTRSSSNPDIGAHEFLSPVCAGSPSVTSVLTPTYAICPGNDVSIALSDYFSDLGITYQWRASTSSSVGPFTNITGATQPMLSVSNVTATTWYSPVITCTNSSQFISPVGMVQVAGTTTSSVPYLEDFENVAGFDKLPNCSWSVPDLGNSAYIYTQPNTQDRIPYSGSNFASAYYSPNSSKYFFTNGIQLNAGVVYSASVMYITNYSGSTNWDLEIMIGSSQSTTALSTIAAAAPAVAPAYNSLSNTFTVASSGLYYIAVNATSNGSGSSYLSWDDLRIDIPCEVNSPTVSVSASQASVCSGQSVAITALGADSYTWNNGAYTGSVISVTPYSTTGYTVTGTNDASGCSTSAVQVIMVRPSPMISAFASSPNVCSGTQVNLMAVGANSYSWSTGNNGSSTVVTPVTTGNATTASYTVLGTNAEGCSGQAVATITVNPAPSISVQAPLSICVGESVDATANGATSYNWMSSSSFLSGNPVTLSPMASTSYTVEGTDANGCTGSYVFSLGVDECTGIAANQLSSLRIFPNPTNGGVTLSNIVTGANVRVTDIAGRTMLEATAGAQELSVDLSRLASGIYYVRVSHAGGTDIARIIKN